MPIRTKVSSTALVITEMGRLELAATATVTGLNFRRTPASLRVALFIHMRVWSLFGVQARRMHAGVTRHNLASSVRGGGSSHNCGATPYSRFLPGGQRAYYPTTKAVPGRAPHSYVMDQFQVGRGGKRNNAKMNTRALSFVYVIMHPIQQIFVTASKTPRAVVGMWLAERNRPQDYCFGELIVTFSSP